VFRRRVDERDGICVEGIKGSGREKTKVTPTDGLAVVSVVGCRGWVMGMGAGRCGVVVVCAASSVGLSVGRSAEMWWVTGGIWGDGVMGVRVCGLSGT
jgi:hypothetical protein